MATQTKATDSPQGNHSSKPRDIKEKLKDRQSSELVIALCGPLGCGIKSLVPLLTTELQSLGYTVEHIRVSELMTLKVQREESLKYLNPYLPEDGASGFPRYDSLQTVGNKIRQAINNSVLAKLAIEDIGARRGESIGNNQDAAQEDSDETEIIHTATKRTAYIIDQLKHHDEAHLLRTVYGSLFYMLGVLSKQEERLNRLEMEDRITPEEAHKLINRDKREDADFGQKLEKTLQLADYFIRNKSNNTAEIKKALKRFLELIHRKNGITPTRQEVGMYAAFSASLESACLSRQVGAAIATKDGRIISTGKNDVPAPGGGLYNEDHGEKDYRCIHKGGKCYNDEYKTRLEKEITDLLRKKPEISDLAKATEIAHEIAANTQIASLIEYSRAIHAEMDAIVALSRNPSLSTQESTLYATTYPCHNCARHIVAAGITKVVYIQPYEKSLAEKLHDDAITSSGEEGKIPFLPFEGVAPQRYQTFFIEHSPRKKDGQAVEYNLGEAKNVDEEFTISYLDREKAAVNTLILSIEAASDIRIV